MMACEDMVLVEECYWQQRAVSCIGLTIVVDDIVVHVFVFMDVSVIVSITVGELIRVLERSELHILCDINIITHMQQLIFMIEMLTHKIVNFGMVLLMVMSQINGLNFRR